MSMVILGTDPGFQNLGWCVYSGLLKKPIEAGVHVLEKDSRNSFSDDFYARNGLHAKFILSLVRKHYVTWIATEDVSALRDTVSSMKLAAIHAGIRWLAEERGLDHYHKPAAYIKAQCAGKGSSKDEAVAWTEERWPGLLRGVEAARRNHAADAVMAAHVCFNASGI